VDSFRQRRKKMWSLTRLEAATSRWPSRPRDAPARPFFYSVPTLGIYAPRHSYTNALILRNFEYLMLSPLQYAVHSTNGCPTVIWLLRTLNGMYVLKSHFVTELKISRFSNWGMIINSLMQGAMCIDLPLLYDISSLTGQFSSVLVTPLLALCRSLAKASRWNEYHFLWALRYRIQLLQSFLSDYIPTLLHRRRSKFTDLRVGFSRPNDNCLIGKSRVNRTSIFLGSLTNVRFRQLGSFMQSLHCIKPCSIQLPSLSRRGLVASNGTTRSCQILHICNEFALHYDQLPNLESDCGYNNVYRGLLLG